jgi:hypothetical protein
MTDVGLDPILNVDEQSELINNSNALSITPIKMFIVACFVIILIVLIWWSVSNDKEGLSTAYEESYRAPFPACATTPYSGLQGYGQYFTQGPPNVG